MNKIPTIFVRDWDGTIGPPARLVLDLGADGCEWVFAGEGVATVKYDGTCCLIRDGRLFKRQEVREGKLLLEGFEVVGYDSETGKTVGWLPVGDGPEDKWHREAFTVDPPIPLRDGTYELVGPKVQGNPERFDHHALIDHSEAEQTDAPRDYDGLRDFFAGEDIEGVVWHHPDGRMAKVKAKDFGLTRGKVTV